MSEHHLIIERDEAALARLATIRTVTQQDREDLYRWSIECSDPSACPGWIECREPHEADGVSAKEGPWETPCVCDDIEGFEDSVPWCGRERFEFHGVPHEWRDHVGWCVEMEGCPVQYAYGGDPIDGIRTDRDGRYAVSDDWDECTCYLELIEEAR